MDKSPDREQRFGRILATLLRSRDREIQAKDLGYNERTARLDLAELDGLRLKRIRGGLCASEGLLGNRLKAMSAAKHDIARAAAQLFRSGLSAYVGCGTTVYLTVQELRAHRLSVPIYTNNLALVDLVPGFGEDSGSPIHIVGGRYLSTIMGTVGEAMREGFPRSLRWALIGAAGIDRAGRIFIESDEEDAVIQCALEHVQDRVVIVASIDKIGQTGPWEVASLEELTEVGHNGRSRQREVFLVTNNPVDFRAELDKLDTLDFVTARDTLRALQELAALDELITIALAPQTTTEGVER